MIVQNPRRNGILVPGAGLRRLVHIGLPKTASTSLATFLRCGGYRGAVYMSRYRAGWAPDRDLAREGIKLDAFGNLHVPVVESESAEDISEKIKLSRRI